MNVVKVAFVSIASVLAFFFLVPIVLLVPGLLQVGFVQAPGTDFGGVMILLALVVALLLGIFAVGLYRIKQTVDIYREIKDID